MRYLAVFILFTFTCTVSAQTRQQQKVDSVFNLVTKYLNEKNADAIYNLTGAGFQHELDIDAFNKVAKEQLFPLGQVKASSLINFVNNSLAAYKLEFNAIKLKASISLDSRDKIETLVFTSYTEPLDNKTALVATSNPMQTLMDKQVDTAARKYIQKANTVGLSIGIIKDGNTTLYNYGEMTRGGKTLPTADSFFEIGSITKTFTATLLAWFVNEKKVRLNDPIIMYLPDSVAVNQQLKGITLLNLINHTSGLVSVPDNLRDNLNDPLNPYKDYDKQHMYSYLKSCKLISKPGEKYAYSNLGVGLLGSILQSVSGQVFEEMVREIIARPLGMFSTSQYLNPLFLPRFVSVYNINGQQTIPWDFDVLAPCGALRSSVNDLLKYAGANMKTKPTRLSAAIQLTHKITFSKDVRIGMGWHVINVKGINYYFHNGGTYGSSSFMAFNAEKGIAIVLLSNAAETVDSVGSEILEKLSR